MASASPQRQKQAMTPPNAQTQARQTDVWKKPSLQLPRVVQGSERFDGTLLKLKHVVPSPGQRRYLLSMECGSADAPQRSSSSLSSPFANAEQNIARLAKGSRRVVVSTSSAVLLLDGSAKIPWDELMRADNSKLHASSYVPKFDDMVCCSTPPPTLFCELIHI
jgi:hypothetical protein